MKDIPALLEKNLEIMSKYQPKLAQRLRQELDSLDELPVVDVQETASGRWVKVGESAPFFDKEPVLPSKHKSKDTYCFIIQGIGYPPYLFHVLRGISKDSLSIVVLESDANLLLLTFSMTSVYHAAPQASRVSFIVFPERELVDEAIWYNVTPIGIFPILEAENIVHSGLQETEKEVRSKLNKEFWEQIRFRAEQLGNSAEDTLLGVRHGALNAYWILNGPKVADIQRHLGGRPAVCIASGPSLKKNVMQLKGRENDVLLVACDTSLIPLLRRGIRPHIVVTIERNLMYDVWIPQVLEEFYDECRDILLVSQSVSEPQTAGRWPGEVFIVGKMDSPADTWLVQDVLGMNLLASGMCVAHMAMTLALALNAPVVALIGQDLAFADDGETTHIEDASSATPDGIVKERSYAKRDVPGACGGTVKTHQMWFYYLQIFERFLEDIGSGKVFQCSEGGAAIAGTECISLAKFFEEKVVVREKTDISAELRAYRRESSESEYEAAQADFQARVHRALAGLDLCDDLVDKMEGAVRHATSPALLPEKRRTFALQAADYLDALHASHRALAFIGQSYTHLAGASLAKNRFLDTVERVGEWKEVHQEIIDSHRVNIAFLRQWLQYMEAMCRPEIAARIRELEALSEEDYIDMLASFLRDVFNSSSPDPLSTEAVLLTHLLCRVDLRFHHNLSPEVLWNTARFLMAEGRYFEARSLMESAYTLLEGSEASSDTISLFLLDWAKAEGGHDLVRMPRTDFAILLLENILERSPRLTSMVEQEKQRLLASQRKLNAVVDSLKLMGGDELFLMKCRNYAGEALNRHDLPEAFRWIQKMMRQVDHYPAWVVSHIQWLVKTALDCRGALDPKIDEACNDVLDFVFSKRDELSEAGLLWPSEWSEYLGSKGYDVSFVVSKSNEA